jgi:hypothetical protein
MTTSSFMVASETANDTQFRAWGGALSNAITAVGIIKTADTGQIDWTTVANPADNSYGGYEVRAFDDSLQSTNPLFLKIEFGRLNNLIAMRLSLGTGTNGSGTLTGQFMTTGLVCQTRQNNATPSSCFVSSDGSYLTVGLFVPTAHATFFAIERTKDSFGQNTALGALIMSVFGGSSINAPQFRHQFFPYTGVIPDSLLNQLGVFTPAGISSGVDGADVNFYPNFFFRNGSPLNPPITHFGYFNADVTAGGQSIVPVYGQNRNYIFFGNASITGFSRGAIIGTAPAMLYE